MIESLVKSLFGSFFRSVGWQMGKKVTNHGDTRWECESCGSIKPKIAHKFYTNRGVVCRKCAK